MKRNLSLFTSLCLCTALLFGCASQPGGASGDSSASSYPEDSIQLCVPYSAGGANDSLARLIAEKAQEKWGQPVEVINQTGVNAAVVEWMSKPSDGYSMMIIPYGELAGIMASDTSFPIGEDQITYVAKLSTHPLALVVNANSPNYQDFEEFVQWCRANPTEVTWGAGSMSGISAIAIAQLMQVIGVDFADTRIVTTTGSSDIATKVAGDHIVMGFGNVTGYSSLIEAGRLRVLAVSPFRDEWYPDVQTVEEWGYEGATVANGNCLIMPAGVPQDVVDRWNELLSELYADQDFLDEFATFQVTPDYMGSEEFTTYFDEQLTEFTAVAEETGLRK